MQKFKYIIVEDLPHIAEDLQFFVDKFPNYDFRGLALNLTEAIQLIKKQKPQLVFLDIELNQESGFDLIKLIEENKLNVPCIIVNSRIKDYAINSFEIDAIYFIDKPYTTSKIQKALELFEKKYNNKNDTLYIKNSDGEHFIKFGDIYFIEANGTYSNLYTTENQTFRFAKNLKEISQQLNQNFIRIHRGFIINKQYKERIKGQKLFLKPLLIKGIDKAIETVIKNGIAISEKYTHNL